MKSVTWSHKMCWKCVCVCVQAAVQTTSPFAVVLTAFVWIVAVSWSSLTLTLGCTASTPELEKRLCWCLTHRVCLCLCVCTLTEAQFIIICRWAPRLWAPFLCSSGAGGVPFAFLNGLEISSQTGIIYFTDSSSRWGRRHVKLEVRAWKIWIYS